MEINITTKFKIGDIVEYGKGRREGSIFMIDIVISKAGTAVKFHLTDLEGDYFKQVWESDIIRLVRSG